MAQFSSLADAVAFIKDVAAKVDALARALSRISVDQDLQGFQLGDIHVRWGSQALSVTASTVSGTQTVNHGIDGVPNVQLTLLGIPGFGAAQGVNLVAAPTSSQFQYQVDFSVAATGAFTVFWVAIG